ncbi:hypothetical protein KCU64_g48, partial [Aureobasidium melanogenum]
MACLLRHLDTRHALQNLQQLLLRLNILGFLSKASLLHLIIMARLPLTSLTLSRTHHRKRLNCSIQIIHCTRTSHFRLDPSRIHTRRGNAIMSVERKRKHDVHFRFGVTRWIRKSSVWSVDGNKSWQPGPCLSASAAKAWMPAKVDKSPVMQAWAEGQAAEAVARACDEDAHFLEKVCVGSSFLPSTLTIEVFSTRHCFGQKCWPDYLPSRLSYKNMSLGYLSCFSNHQRPGNVTMKRPRAQS